MSAENKALVDRFFEEMCNGRKLALANEIFAANHAYHDPANAWVGAGPEGMQQVIAAYHGAFGDAHWSADETLLAGDRVITRWTGTGTHTGNLQGIAPTGKKVRITGIWMNRIAGGKIAESWNAWDALGILQQIGVVPALGKSAGR